MRFEQQLSHGCVGHSVTFVDNISSQDGFVNQSSQFHVVVGGDLQYEQIRLLLLLVFEGKVNVSRSREYEIDTRIANSSISTRERTG